MGGVSYKLYSGLSKIKFKEKTLSVIFIIFLFITFSYNYLHINIPLVSPRHHTDWLYYVGLLIVIPFVFSYTKKNRFDRFIGELSYPAYIIHTLIITLTVALFPGISNSAVYPLVVIVATMVVSILLALFVDRKVDGWRQKRLRLSPKKKNQFYGFFPKLPLKKRGESD